MLDIRLGDLDTRKKRYTPWVAWTCKHTWFLVAWTRENAWLELGTTMLDTLLCGTWFQLGTAMLHTPWAAWTHENTWFRLGTTMLDPPPCREARMGVFSGPLTLP